MAVNFVFGSVSDRPAGPVQRRIFSESRRSPEKIFYVLVPEQSTLQEERAWMTASPDHVLANIQVVSFTGLAYRVLDEREVSPGTLLDDTGKAMILRRILREKADALPSFRREQDKPGFAGQLAQAMDELSLSCAEPALLDQILADAKLPQSLKFLQSPFRLLLHSIQMSRSIRMLLLSRICRISIIISIMRRREERIIILLFRISIITRSCSRISITNIVRRLSRRSRVCHSSRRAERRSRISPLPGSLRKRVRASL